MATKKFEVRDGFTFGIHGQYKAGDVLELDESAGVAFADKLKPVSDKRETVNDATPPAVPFLYLTEKQRNALIGAGFDQAKADEAKDVDLLALGGIGEGVVKVIRENKGK